jgi:hypothetical protein
MSPAAPTRRMIASRIEFQEALRSAIAQAAHAQAFEIRLCDRDFADWPLGERVVVEQLARWAGPRRRLLLVASTFDEFPRRHARWTEWHRTWSHVVECRANEELEAEQFPTLCVVPGVISVRLLDAVRHRGMASHEASDEQACLDAIDAVSQRSVPAFPPTALGL